MKASIAYSTTRIRVVLGCSIILVVIAGFRQAFGAQAQPRPLITEAVSDTKLVTLAGNTRPEANAKNDRGPVADSFRIEHMFLQLRRSPEREQALEHYIDQLSDPQSPNYHHWLTPKEIGQRYGLAPEDMATITGWLRSHGFTVNVVYPNGMVIDFSGTAGQVREAFHTEVHQLNVNGTKHIANVSDPRIPAALAPAVVGIVSLHDFRPHQMHKAGPDYSPGGLCGLYTPCHPVVPADLATIYDLNPLFSEGISGKGQIIAVVEDSDVFNPGNAVCAGSGEPSGCCTGVATGSCGPGDWDTFRSTFGLSTAFPSGSFRQFQPPPPGGTSNCTDPGAVAFVEVEPILDAEWASAAAPNATIVMGSCGDVSTGTFGATVASGVFVALQNILNGALTPVPNVVSVSYGESEAVNGTASNAAIESLYQTAVGEGVSVFVASGDAGADANDADREGGPATFGLSVSGFASTEYNVAVGGTDFGDVYAGTSSTYWSSSNGTTYGSALSYIPEIPWNDSCASELLAGFLGFSSTYGSSGLCNSLDAEAFPILVAVDGGGGGPSSCATGAPSTPGVVSGSCVGWSKPSYQSVFGNPSDGVRDLPDISLFAADGLLGHCYVLCDTHNASCSGAPSTWPCAGGTSFASPIMAGIQALVDQSTGSSQANPNPFYYFLARTEYGASGNSSCNSTLGNGVASSCIFHDVTQGDMDEPCTIGDPDCFADGLPGGLDEPDVGVLSTSTSVYQPAYPATTGWNFATGIGTVDAYNLASAWPSAIPTPTATATATATGATPTATPSSKTTPTATATATTTATATPTPVPVKLKIKPATLSFGTVEVGRHSGPKNVTVSNPRSNKKKPGVTVLMEGLSGPSSPYNVTNDCTGPLLPGDRCTIGVTFTPAGPGPQDATLTIIDNAERDPQSVNLKGMGKAPK
ncbi:MAG: protease pro-enzyme activation domain-containing protein [Candidatus Binatus sp.]|uniref:protease pro-enzyme activation domain-containing protein n=1 Tax=Candidatus Binatus sp. TaxID=2811406 RepID=UPI003BB07A56